MSNNQEWTQEDIQSLCSPLDNHYYDQFAETMGARGYVFKTAEELDAAVRTASQLRTKVEQAKQAAVSPLLQLTEKIAADAGLATREEVARTNHISEKIAAAAQDPFTMYSVAVLSHLAAQKNANQG
jgi:hypothetical protein